MVALVRINKTHCDRIKARAIEAHTIALAAFAYEAQTLVQIDCAGVVGADLKLYANDAIPPRMGKCRHHELLADAASTVVGKNAHSKGATMLERLHLIGEDIAPAYNGRTVNSDVLRGVVPNAFANELFDSLERRCFRPRKEFPFPRYCVETGSESFDVGFSDLYDLD